jgi:hypothetical protein
MRKIFSVSRFIMSSSGVFYKQKVVQKQLGWRGAYSDKQLYTPLFNFDFF